MNLTTREFYNPNLLINIFFSFFPISLILGSLVTNLNILFFCCLGIFHLKSRIFEIKLGFSLKIIFLFFFIIFFSTFLTFAKSLYFEGYEYENLVRLIKSALFLRYLLMLLIVYLLIDFEILNFKYFFYSAAIVTIILSLDIIFQYIFGFDILGLKSNSYYNSGFFGEELMAGGFVQKFSFFSIFFSMFIFKNNKIRLLSTSAIICILGAAIIFSGNRMPLLLFIIGLLLIFIFYRRLKIIIPVGLIGLAIIINFVFSSNATIKANYLSFYGQYTNTIINSFKIFSEDQKENYDTQEKNNLSTENEKDEPIVDDFYSFWQKIEGIGSGHKMLFLTAIDTWKLNKIFGNGIKSFRIDCIEFRDHKKNRLCSNHPHNYYLEILTETGIIGLILVAIIGILFVVFIFRNLKFFKGNNVENLILSAAMVSFFIEIFPFRSTGSIFTTNNTTYLILISSIILSYKKLLAPKNSI